MDAVLLDLYRRHVLTGRLTAPRQDEVVPYGRNASNEQFLSLIRTLTTAVSSSSEGRAFREQDIRQV
jgi:hypothetical protein